LKGGHQCVVFDMSAKAVAELAKERLSAPPSLAEFTRVWRSPRGLADGAGGVVDKTIAICCPISRAAIS